jgi:phosphoribosylanthranilate isomerase
MLRKEASPQRQLFSNASPITFIFLNCAPYAECSKIQIYFFLIKTMGLKTVVKVGNVTNLSDARYCAGMGVDFLGFRVIGGQPDAISAKAFQEIRGWISGPQIVAELYGIQDASELPSILENFRPDYFELSLEDWQRVGNALTLPYILLVNADDHLPAFATPPDYLLTDAESGSFSRFVPEFDILARLSDKATLSTVLHHTGVAGVSLNGGREIRPGLKSYDELAEILEALEED